MIAIRPRETRLPIDTVRDAIKANPIVLLVVGRTPTSTEVKFHTLTLDAFNVAFATHFFYLDNTTKETRLLMVPLALNGDE